VAATTATLAAALTALEKRAGATGAVLAVALLEAGTLRGR